MLGGMGVSGDSALAGPPGNFLANGEVLLAGQSLNGGNGVTLTMQGDGNLVLYHYGTAYWASWTQGNPGARLGMQGDGNLVIYSPSNVALWSSGTNGNPGSYFVAQADGNLVVYRPGNVAVWNSGTGWLVGWQQSMLMPRTPDWRPDNEEHTFCYENIAPINQPAYAGSMEYLDANSVFVDNGPLACSAATDVRFWETGDPQVQQPTLRGSTQCIARTASGQRCDSFRVRVYLRAILDQLDGTAGNYDVNVAKTIRHEIGHTVALNHYDMSGRRIDSAMVSGPVTTSLTWTTYTNNQIGWWQNGLHFT